MVKSEPVQAFMYVFKDQFSMLKNGSLTGYLLLPQRAVCSRICGRPLSFSGIVLRTIAKELLISSLPK